MLGLATLLVICNSHCACPAVSCGAQGTKGLSFGKPESKLGWNAQPTTAVMFDDVRIPATNLVGKVGDRAGGAMPLAWVQQPM